MSLKGDKDAFGALVEKYKSAVYALAYEFTRNVADAEDISQEAFIKAYLKLSTLRDRTKVATWLRQITRSLCVDWQRKQARRREVSFGELVEANGKSRFAPPLRYGQEQSFANLPKTPEEELEKKEFRETILAALDSLSETNRLTTILYYIDGLSYREIASLQDVPVSTVNERLYQARKQLKKELIVLMDKTLKAQAPAEGFTQAVLKDLELVQQKLEGGKAWLIAKEERTGAILCGALADLDGDGKSEIIVGTHRGYVLAFAASGDILWRYTHEGEISAIAAKDANAKRKGEVIFLSDNELCMLDAEGRRLWNLQTDRIESITLLDMEDGDYKIITVENIPKFGRIARAYSRCGRFLAEYSTFQQVQAMAIGDLTGDGIPEIAFATQWELSIFPHQGYSPEKWAQWDEEHWSFSVGDRGYKSFDKLCMADIDGDGQLELIARNSEDGIIAFNHHGEEMWKCGLKRYTEHLAAGDVNGDGKDEIVALGGEAVSLIDSHGKLVWKKGLDSWGYSVKIFDIDGDGKAEIIISTCRWNQSVSVLDEYGEQKWQYPLGSDVAALACRDIEKDGEVETIIVADDLYVLTKTGNVKWVYRCREDFVVAIGDVDSDGVPEIIAGSSGVAPYKGDGKVLWWQDTSAVSSIALEQDKNGKVKHIAVGCLGRKYYLLAPDGSLKWQQEVKKGDKHIDVAFGDVNGDGESELIVAGGAMVRLHNKNGQLLWCYIVGQYSKRQKEEYFTLLPARTYCLVTGNLDDAKVPRVVFSQCYGLYTLDGKTVSRDNTEPLWKYQDFPPPHIIDNRGQSPPKYPIISLVAADIDADGYDEIVGASFQRIYCFKGDGSLLWDVEPLYPRPKQSKLTYPVKCVHCADLDGDGKKEIIAGIAGITAHTVEGKELWHAKSSGAVRDIIVGDVNSDNIPEIVVASDELEVFSANGQKLFSYGEGGKFSSVALGDVDDDGVLEIVAGGAGVYVFKMS